MFWKHPIFIGAALGVLTGVLVDRLASLVYPSAGQLLPFVATGLVGALIGLVWQETSGG